MFICLCYVWIKKAWNLMQYMLDWCSPWKSILIKLWCLIRCKLEENQDMDTISMAEMQKTWFCNVDGCHPKWRSYRHLLGEEDMSSPDDRHQRVWRSDRQHLATSVIPFFTVVSNDGWMFPGMTTTRVVIVTPPTLC